MIKESSYRCSSADAPAEASFICYQEGCTIYPFLCGNPKCTCMTLHDNHNCNPLNGVLKTLALPPKLSGDLSKEEKDINSLIDRLIGELQSLKQRHKIHVERHSLNSRKYAGLLQRLLQGQQLQNKEATGDAIGKMVAEGSQVDNIQSPYRLAGEQLINELQTMETTAQQLLSCIEQLWRVEQVQVIPQAYQFSNERKHKDIELEENNTRAKYTSSGWKLVVVEPSVSGGNLCRAIFKVNQIGEYGWAAVGVCLPSVVAANGYLIEGNFRCYADNIDNMNHGIFVVSNYGSCDTHGNYSAQTACKFSVGESVSVEWDGARREMKWSVLGTHRRHALTLPSEHLQASLHFVLWMKDSDVSLINE